MRSRSSAGAPAMLFQLAGSPVQRQRPRYTSAPHEVPIITLPPCLSLPITVPPFSVQSSVCVLAMLMFSIKQTVNTLPSLLVKLLSQETCKVYGLFFLCSYTSARLILSKIIHNFLLHNWECSVPHSSPKPLKSLNTEQISWTFK